MRVEGTANHVYYRIQGVGFRVILDKFHLAVQCTQLCIKPSTPHGFLLCATVTNPWRYGSG